MAKGKKKPKKKERKCRILLEGPPLDGAKFNWPIEQHGLPLRIQFDFEAGQQFEPMTRPDGLPKGKAYPTIRYKLAALPDPSGKKLVASYISEHDMKRYGPEGS